MNNWFERHPATSILGWTIIVGTVVWAAFYFIYDTSKIDSYKAQIESYKAQADTYKGQIDIAKIRTDQYVAKTDVLETQLRQLRDENSKLLKWLENAPNTIPYFEKQINELTKDNTKLKEQSIITAKGEGLVYKPGETPYSYTKTFMKGESFVDPKTKAVLGVKYIYSGNDAEIRLQLPGSKGEDLKNISPGTSWDFVDGGKKYKLIITILNYYTGTAEANVIEIPMNNIKDNS
jgi:hypothetical protein